MITAIIILSILLTLSLITNGLLFTWWRHAEIDYCEEYDHHTEGMIFHRNIYDTINKSKDPVFVDTKELENFICERLDSSDLDIVD